MTSRRQRRPGRATATAGSALLLAGCAAAAPPPPTSPAPPASTRSLPAVEAPPPFGAEGADPNEASGAGTLLIYSSITGHVPFAELTRQGVVYRDRGEGDREAARAAEIEREIAARRAEPLPDVAGAAPVDAAAALGAELRVAPRAPSEEPAAAAAREIERVAIPAGRWGNDQPLAVIRHRLDLDGDGESDEIQYYDVASGHLVRRAEDRDGDGRPDTWSSYDRRGLIERVLDLDGDGSSNVWEQYARGRMTTRRVDREGDGDVEAVYHYGGDSLVEERHDVDGDGAIDLVIHYEGRVRVRAEEDRNRDGRTDTWTTYALVDGREVVASVERDEDGDGRVDAISRAEHGGDAPTPVSEGELSPL